jgi:hypothetical protein
VAIENLWLESEYAYPTDEAHGWNGIELSNVEDAWVRQVTRYLPLVRHAAGARNVTIEDCAARPVPDYRQSPVFIQPDDFVLRSGSCPRGPARLITGSRMQGPNVCGCLAVNCRADWQSPRYGGHAIRQRQSPPGGRESPTRLGHGWSAWTMFWNCEAKPSATRR